MLDFFLRSNKLKNDAFRYFENRYDDLLYGALDSITISHHADAIVHEYAVIYCVDHNLPYQHTETIKKCFQQWSKKIIERGYNSVW
ncbi:MAG: hypothetical protein EOO10_15940 [Chitinophagaceae bacterium]|nr:MAG: hypothetical protein EOO10_15940 [Chitinophagaceae bacterium]